ncbi:MAG TPA: hypothetical protein VFA60_03375 [Terriglobales bacterium]|nr:hypothetical protein [Terriglobales bacterium]
MRAAPTQVPSQAGGGHKRPPESTRAPSTELSKDLLAKSETQARALPPAMRSLALAQIAAAEVLSERDHAVSLLREAFLAATSIQDDPTAKDYLQDLILQALIPLNQAAADELTQQAEERPRRAALGLLMGQAARHHQFDRALDILNRLAGEPGDFPYQRATELMMAIPAERNADRVFVFGQAFNHYKGEPAATSMHVTGETFSRMLARFWNWLPKAMVLEAIEEILAKAKKADGEEGVQVTAATAEGSASFNSYYEYCLFEVLPVLRKLDPQHADSLLRDTAQLRPVIEKYANGLQSLDPTIRDTPLGPGEHSSLNVGLLLKASHQGSDGLVTPFNTDAQVRSQYRAEVARIIEASRSNPMQALARADSLPEVITGYWARAAALQGIAGVALKSDPSAASSAVGELRRLAGHVESQYLRATFLISVADLYLTLGNRDAAQEAIQDGTKCALALYDKDKNPDDPNKAMKAFWPSTAVWRLFIVLASRISLEAANEIIDSIRDDDIRISERVALAVALAGATPRRNVVIVKTKGSMSQTTLDLPE